MVNVRSNKLKKLQESLRGNAGRIYVGEIVSHNSDGTSTIRLQDARRFTLYGQSVPVGESAIIRDNVILQPAPTGLPFYSITI